MSTYRDAVEVIGGAHVDGAGPSPVGLRDRGGGQRGCC